MKKEILIRIVFIFCLSLMLNAASAQIQDNAIDDVGDIAFVAYTTNSLNGMAGFAFVLLDNCPANTSIGFSDDEWTGSSFAPVNEGEIIWTTSAAVAKGTVIKIAGPITAGPNSNVTWTNSNSTANIGSISASGQFTTTSGDQLFAMTGNRTTPGTLLAFVGTSITATGLVMNGTGLGTGSSANSNIVLNSNAVLTTQGNKYTGSTVCNGTVIDCKTMVNTTASWGASGALTSVAAFYAAIPSFFGGSVLPIELISFTGKTADKTNVLTWATATEQNNAGFEVERSTDGVYFSNIGFVRGAGNSTTQRDYTFMDGSPAIYCGSSRTTTYCGSTYYRLKQTDFDGKYEYSNIVTLGSNTDATVTVYPNPSTGVFTIDSKGWSGQATTAVISNSLGQTYTVAINGNQINLTEFPAGVYFLRLQIGERARVIRLVKL